MHLNVLPFRFKDKLPIFCRTYERWKPPKENVSRKIVDRTNIARLNKLVKETYNYRLYVPSLFCVIINKFDIKFLQTACVWRFNNVVLQSISQSFCQNTSNFVPKFASSLRSSKFILKITNRFFKQSIWLDYFNSWANRGFVYKLAFKFQYELLNFATNLRTLERNLEYFGKSFVKSTVI